MSEQEEGGRASPAWWAWLQHLRFRTKLALMVNLLLLLLVAGSAFLFEHRQRTATIQEVEKRALIMAQAIDSAVAADLMTYNYVSIEQTVRKFGEKPDVVYVVVLDKEGGVAAQFLRNYPLAQHVGQRGLPPQAAGPTIAQVHVPGTQQDTVYDVYWPVRIEGSPEPWGTIRLGVSLRGLHQDLAKTRWQISGIGVLALLVGSLAATFLANRMTRPIQGLMQGAAAVGRGDLTHRIEVTSRDELGRLSEAFNEMTTQLVRVRDLEERLRRADRLAALGTMAAGIAHDIRNPLTSILIFSQLMSLHHDDPEVRAKFDRIVPRELERVQGVIEDMMELARPTALQFEPTNLNEVLAQALELLESQAASQGVKLVREFGPELPYCMADRKRIHRCFSNLLTNAIQAMPRGGDLTVRTWLGPDRTMPSAPNDGGPEPMIRVTITDTGQGIPPERLSRIFDPFYTTKEKGLGLGMAITHRIVEDHKGTIDVQSQVGLGTTFIIHLPLTA
jgi:signal transduction histidine kinase